MKYVSWYDLRISDWARDDIVSAKGAKDSACSSRIHEFIRNPWQCCLETLPLR